PQREPQVLGRLGLPAAPLHARRANRLHVAPQDSAVVTTLDMRGGGLGQRTVRLLFQHPFELRAWGWAHQFILPRHDLFGLLKLSIYSQSLAPEPPLAAWRSSRARLRSNSCNNSRNRMRAL